MSCVYMYILCVNKCWNTIMVYIHITILVEIDYVYIYMWLQNHLIYIHIHINILYIYINKLYIYICISSGYCANQLVQVSYTWDILALCPSKGSIRYKNRNKHALAELDVSSHLCGQSESNHLPKQITTLCMQNTQIYNCICMSIIIYLVYRICVLYIEAMR